MRRYMLGSRGTKPIGAQQLFGGLTILTLAIASTGLSGPAMAGGVSATAASSAPAPSLATQSDDVAVNGWGDSAGYHLAVSTGGGWQQVATIKPANIDSQSWVGYQCTSGDGRFEAVTVLPSLGVNTPSLRDRGANAYSVDLQSGVVRPVVSGVSYQYHTPGCGVADTAVFTSNEGTDEQSTDVYVADLASGQVVSTAHVDAQVTSAVPTATGVVGAVGTSLVSVLSSGKLSNVVTTTGQPFDLRPSADGGVDYLVAAEKPDTSGVWHETKGQATEEGSGPLTSTHLFQGLKGHSVVTGATKVATTSGLVAGSDAGLPSGPQGVSLGGDRVFGYDRSGDESTPLVHGGNGAVTKSGAPSGSPAPVLTAPAPVAIQPTKVNGAMAMTAPVVDLTPMTPPSPVCAVPRNDPTRQVLQPNRQQVDWAVQMAEQGLLTGSLARPANYANMGLVSYSPSSDFAPVALSHPSGDTFNSVPRSVYEAIMAQESNWDQASFHALPGIAGNPLVADYYGAAGSIDTINYAAADCGYGIGQVTQGMRASDTSPFSTNGKTKIAVDYEENIAAGLQILEKTWNSLYAAGITANGGNPRYLENWYFAAWAYNTGIQPAGGSCTPGPSCTGPDGTWGLGWTNNPQNASYPPSRLPFLKTTYADAAHPGDWPYQERVMGWMGSPLLNYQGTASYATPQYHGGSSWLQIPSFSSFCTTGGNDCDPTYINMGNPSLSYCTLSDRECWWHTPVTWVASCSTTCATANYTVGSGSTEPATSDPHPPTCNLDTSLFPTTSHGAPIVVDDESSPPLNVAGCSSVNWSNSGSFTYTAGTDGSGNPIGIVDTHQLGAGFGGRILFTHTEDGSKPELINTGTWTPSLPSTQYYSVFVHIPATGAAATDVVYTVNPGGGVSPFKVRVNQHLNQEAWIPLGTFAMSSGGNVVLTNKSSMNPGSYDVAFDALVFMPQGGTPGTPIGGPPGIIEEPGGSNPAWSQCPCTQTKAGDPVDTATGYYSDSTTDLSTPGRGAALNFARTYNSGTADPSGPNSALAVNGPFGYGWTFSYGLSAATNGATGAVTITQEDGSAAPFTVSGGVYSPAAPREDATLTKSGSTYTFTRRGTQVFTFDVTTGHLLTETDLAGANASTPYATTMAYNGSGQLSTITDPGGRVYTLTWTSGHITSLVDSAGRTVTYAYDGSGNLTDVYGVGTTRTPTLLDNDHAQYTYYSGTHLIQTVRTPDQYGVVATPTPVMSLVYDGSERVTSQTNQIGNTTAFEYGPNVPDSLVTGQTLVTDPAGHKTLDTYAGGLLTSEVRGYGTAVAGTTAYTYDPVSLGVTTVTDPNGHVTSYTYDLHGNRTSSTDALGYTTSYTYNALKQVVTTVDPNGNETINGYDEAGHISVSGGGTNSGTLYIGDPTSVTQTDVDQSAEVSGTEPIPGSSVTGYFYDDAAHPADRTRVVDPNGHTDTSTYDTVGDLATVTDPLGHKTLFGWDTTRGWATSQVSPNGYAAGTATSCTPPAVGCTTYAHDAYGHVTQTTDPLGHTTKASYDADGNKTSSTDGDNNTTTYTFDAADEATQQTRPDSSVLKTSFNADGTIAAQYNGANIATAYTYDAQSRPIHTTDGDSRTTITGYDLAGNVTTVQDPAGKIATTTYDVDNRPTAVSYSDGTTPGVSAIKYDPAGRKTSETDGTGTTTWQYDIFGQLVSTTDGAGNTVSYGYDPAHQQTSITYPGSTGTVNRTFDNAGRLTAIKDWNSQTTNFAYTPDGQLTTSTLPSTAVLTNSYDNADSLSGTTLVKSSTTLASLAYGRDNAAQINAVTPTSLGDTAKTYANNTLQQLTTVNSTATFGYDAADNLTTNGGTAQSFDAADQLCWTYTGSAGSATCTTPPGGATSYTYNTQGDRTAAGTSTYAYTEANQLKSSTVGGTTTTYAYNGAGFRISKTTGATTTHFVWDVTGGSTAPLLTDGTNNWIYGPDGEAFEQINGATTSYLMHNQTGSTVALVDNTGAVTGTYAYNQYGATTAHGGTATTPLQGSGQYLDNETGFTYLRARYYDPATGQFITADPLASMTRSPYSYVNGDPLNGDDLSGLCGGFLGIHCLEQAGSAVGHGATTAGVWVYDHPGDDAAIIGAVALAATGVGAVAELGGLAAFETADIGIEAGLSYDAVGSFAETANTIGGGAGYLSAGVGAAGAIKDCVKEGWESERCATELSLSAMGGYFAATGYAELDALGSGIAGEVTALLGTEQSMSYIMKEFGGSPESFDKQGAWYYCP